MQGGLRRETQAWKFAHNTYVTAPRSYHTKSKWKEFYLLWCEWVKYLLCFALKKLKTWDVSGVWIGQQAIQMESGNIFPLSFQCKCQTVIPQVNQMDEQNVRRCHPLTRRHTHTHTRGGSGRGGEPWLSCSGSSVRPSVRQTTRKNESFITISCLTRLSDVTAGHQIP